jgi:hypothetical protein
MHPLPVVISTYHNGCAPYCKNLRFPVTEHPKGYAVLRPFTMLYVF